MHIKILIFSLYMLSCGDKKATDTAEPEVVIPPPERDSKIEFVNSTFPDYNGGWRKIVGSEISLGQINGDIVLGTTKSTSTPLNDARSAVEKGGVFDLYPGFIFSVSNKNTVEVSLRTASKEQKLKVTPLDAPYSLPEDWNSDPKLAISLGMFPDVFPPSIRDRYELNLKSTDSNGKVVFNYTMTFVVVRSDFTPQYATISPGEGVKGLYLGIQKNKYLLSSISFKNLCEGCTLLLENFEANIVVKKFIEVPALVDSGSKNRITRPSRYKALLTRRITSKISESAINLDGQNSGKINIYVDIPADKTMIEPWCRANGGIIVEDASNLLSNPFRKYLKGCYINALGKSVKTYYGFVSTIPVDHTTNLLGGSEGVASLIINFKGKLTTKRGGKTIEVKDISGDSGIKTPLDGEGIPMWVLDILRDALYSGAPEFDMPQNINL